MLLMEFVPVVLDYTFFRFLGPVHATWVAFPFDEVLTKARKRHDTDTQGIAPKLSFPSTV
jgi:hypothetical protein